MQKRKIWKIIIIILILILTASAAVFARAGGAGGGRSGGGYSGGGSGGGGGGAVIWVIMMLVQTIGPVPTLLIVAAVIIFFAVINPKIKKKSALKDLSVQKRPIEKVSGYKDFSAGNPDFSADDFMAKVRTAFIAIQEAWSARDLSKVRRFITDGVYQRFNTQFKMMSLLKQENPVSDIRIHDITIDKIETDGDYDIIHAAITASMYDKFVCKTNPQLNSPGGSDTFQEFWSFIKKRGKSGKDIFHTNQCPNCSAPLSDDMGEIGKCGYCGAMVNSGEFDWVLSEITQADDYARSRSIEKAQSLKQKVSVLVKEYGDFAVQLAEDKASNAYLQIKTAEVMKDSAIMRRFATDTAFEKLKTRIPDERIVYNRIFLNAVTLVAAQKDGSRNKLTFSVTVSYQRVKLSEHERAEIVDPYIQNHTEFLQMVRDAAGTHSKGSLYTHNCPACGASIQDSLDINCAYCGTPLNSTVSEWIVSDLLDFSEYQAYLKNNAKEMQGKIQPQTLDSLYDVKDYALNNVMIMIGADGKFTEEEIAFVGMIAKKWNFKIDKIQPLFDLAGAGKLSIRMPEDLGKRKRIYELMAKAAEADHEVSPEEKLVLDYVRETFLEGD